MSVLGRKPIEQSLQDIEAPGRSLRRELGPVQLTVIGIGVIVGTGIFVVTGEAAGTLAGPAIAISFAVAGIACFLAGLCYAEFASLVPVAASARRRCRPARRCSARYNPCMQTEAEIDIAKPPAEVFDFIARGERLPEYVTQFEWVKQSSQGEPAQGTEYSYKMARGQAEGTFEWTEFQRPTRLAWHGPPAKAGLGSMEPSGWWEITEQATGTHVKLVMTPEPGGMLKLMAPLMAGSMRKGNAQAMQRLKELIEAGS